MRVAVVVFPGSNCDHDAYHVIQHLLNIDVDFVWHKEKDLSKYGAVIVPGGFAYGDYLRAGAIARFSPIMEEVIKFANRGKPVIGICNGFQILVESGLLPGALINNRNIKFISRDVCIRAENSDTIFTSYYDEGELLTIPIAHRQGNYFAKPDDIRQLKDNGQIAFTYYPEDTDGNPNGSLVSIAGILNGAKNVLGMMPHPERAAEEILGAPDGLKIFQSMLGVS